MLCPKVKKKNIKGAKGERWGKLYHTEVTLSDTRPSATETTNLLYSLG